MYKKKNHDYFKHQDNAYLSGDQWKLGLLNSQGTRGTGTAELRLGVECVLACVVPGRWSALRSLLDTECDSVHTSACVVVKVEGWSTCLKLWHCRGVHRRPALADLGSSRHHLLRRSSSQTERERVST